MTGVGENQLISIQPDELKFLFELEKQSYCDLKVANKTENYVAFKVISASNHQLHMLCLVIKLFRLLQWLLSFVFLASSIR
jgi:hypothetical protein